DVLSEDALVVCYKHAISHQLDFVFFNATLLNEDSVKQLSFDYRRSYIDESQVYRGIHILEHLINTNCYRSSVCLHLVSTELIRQNNLRFHPGIIHEDELFSALVYLYAERVGYINEPF